MLFVLKIPNASSRSIPVFPRRVYSSLLNIFNGKVEFDLLAITPTKQCKLPRDEPNIYYRETNLNPQDMALNLENLPFWDRNVFRGVKFIPGFLNIYPTLALYFANKKLFGEAEKALTAFDKYYRKGNAAFAKDFFQASKASTLLNMSQEAIAYVARAIAAKDGNPHFHHHLGNLLQKTGDLDGAREAQEKAIALDPFIPGPHIQLSHIFNKLGDTELAIQKAKDAIAAKDDNPHFHHHLGNLLQKTGDLDGAREAQEKAIALDPSIPGPHIQLSHIFNQLGDTELAIQKAKDAIAAKDDNPHFHRHLGNLLQKTGDLDGAREAQKKAI